MKPNRNERGSSELAREWNKRLFAEGLRVFSRGREIPLPPECIERLRPLYPSRARSSRDSIPLDELSQREREVLLLLFFEGLSERQASRALGISRSSVKGYKKEALRKLRERIFKEQESAGAW